jgi:hypothetical protein
MAAPTVVRRARLAGPTSNGTVISWSDSSATWVTNTAISASERVLWVMIIASDGTNTMTAPGGGVWTKPANTEGQQGSVTGSIFIAETTAAYAASASPADGLSWGYGGNSEQGSFNLWAFKVAAGKSVGVLYASAAATGSSTNSDPPSVTNNSGASQDCIVVATRCGDSTVTASGAPTNYGNLVTQAGGGTNGASTNSADRSITIANGASENPGTFTSASEQWVSYTFGVYEYDPPPTLTQKAFRFYADGTESGASALEAQDTNVSLVDGNTDFQLRIMLQETAGGADPGTTGYQLYYSKNGAAYTNITGVDIAMFASANLTDGGATTNRLTGGTGTFQAGMVEESSGTIQFAQEANKYTEHLWSLQLVGSQVAVGDTFDFRMRRDIAAISAYDVTPRVTVSSPPVTLTVNGATSATLAESATLTPRYALTAQSATSATLADNVTIVPGFAAQSANSATLADNITLATNYDLFFPSADTSLNKTRGFGIGPNIITNGEFTSNITGWAANNGDGREVVTHQAGTGRMRTERGTADGYPGARSPTASSLAWTNHRHQLKADFVNPSGITALFAMSNNFPAGYFTSTATSGSFDEIVAEHISLQTIDHGYMFCGIDQTSGSIGNYVEWDNVSVRQLDAIILGFTVAGDNAVSATQATNVTLVGHYTLTAQNAVSATLADNVTITAGNVDLVVQDAVSATLSTEVLLGGIDLFEANAVSRPKSGGTTFGPNLIGNGTFDSDINGWYQISGQIMAWSAGKLYIEGNNGSGLGGEARTDLVTPLAIGRRYLLSFESTFEQYGVVILGGSVYGVPFGGTPPYTNVANYFVDNFTRYAPEDRLTDGLEFVAYAAETTLLLQSNTETWGEFDNIQLREANTIVLSANYPLTAQNAVSGTLADNVTLAPKTTLIVQSANSSSAADQATLVPRYALTAANANSPTFADELTLLGIDVTPLNAVSATLLDNVTLLFITTPQRRKVFLSLGSRTITEKMLSRRLSLLLDNARSVKVT